MKFVDLGILLFSCSLLAGDVQVYPGFDPTLQSSRYAVTLLDSQGERHPSFVYQSRNNFPDHASYPADQFMASNNHWTSFSFQDSATVEVTRLDGKPVNHCVIRPSQRQIEAHVQANRAVFTLTQPGQFSVELDEADPWIENPLLIFANPTEEDPPKRNAPNVIDVARNGLRPSDPDQPNLIYFAPGRYNLVEDHGLPLRPGYRLRSGDTVYLAGGAYVVGAFRSTDNATNITVRGRGILSGLGQPWVKSKYRPLKPDAEVTFSYRRCAEHLLELRGSGHQVEGVTFTDPTHFNLNVGSHCHVKNIKCFGWYYSTDGVGLGRSSTLQNSFFKVNDDAIKVYNSHLRAKDCVIWQQQNGAPFQLSWGHRGNERDFLVRRVAIIHDEHSGPANNRAVFSCVRLGRATMRDLLFENITLEGNTFRLFDLRVQAGGCLQNLTVRNLTVTGQVTDGNYLRSDDGTIENIHFENLRINGHPIRNAAQGQFQLGDGVPSPTFH